MNDDPDPLAFLRSESTPRPSIADSIRKDQLKGARLGLYIGGLLLLASAIFSFVAIRKQESQYAEQGVSSEMIAAQMRTPYIILAGLVILGAALLGLGTQVSRKPVVATVAGMVLLLVYAGFVGVVSPISLVSLHSAVMIGIFVALLDGRRAGIALEKRRRAAQEKSG